MAPHSEATKLSNKANLRSILGETLFFCTLDGTELLLFEGNEPELLNHVINGITNRRGGKSCLGEARYLY